MRDLNLRKRYGLTAGQVAAMVAEQDGLCAICRTKAAVHVDHDHATGDICGVLCFTCNVGLGNLRDDLRVIHSAALYLDRALEPLLDDASAVQYTVPSGGPRLPRAGRSVRALAHIERKYGLTERELAGILAVQCGQCVICLTARPEHVDHDHTTGAVRGILCSGCNSGLGNFGDDLGRLWSALRYLLVPDMPLAV